MSMDGSGDIIAASALVKIDVYAAGVECDGNMVAAGSQPLRSQSFTAGQPITLDIPNGTHTVALTAFSDPGGTEIIGAGCMADQDFQPGQKVCIDLSVSQASGNDLSVCNGLDCPCMFDRDCTNATQPRCGPAGLCVPCVSLNDNCPFDQYCDTTNHCNLGCKTNLECSDLAQQNADGGVADVDGGAGAMATNFCDTTRHSCVECLSATDCENGKLCSPSGACVDGCDLSLGKGCKGNLTCCGKFCVDTLTDPLNCSKCGTACTGATNTCCGGNCTNLAADSVHCGSCGTACSTAQATPSCNLGQCNFSCQGNFAHCVTGNTGCETPTNTTSNCGACNNVCDTTHSTGASCNGATCLYTGCTAGYGDCNKNVPNTSGCETNLAMAGLIVCGGACYPNTTCCTNADCGTLPSPQLCYQAGSGMCSGAGGSCSFSLKAGSKVCAGNVCCMPINGTCNVNCTLSCSAGFADCDGDPSNGCEANLNTDLANCGACGRGCSATNVATKTCAGGLCTSSCNGGFGNCTTPAAGPGPSYTPDDGCESNLNTNTNHCGTCANNCATTEVNVNTPSCSAGACTFASCTAGFYNCDGIKANGCEAAGQGGLGCCPAYCAASAASCPAAATGSAMIKHTAIGNPPDTSVTNYYDCYNTGTPYTEGTYNQIMADDAGLGAATKYAGPTASFTGDTIGCYNNKTNVLYDSTKPTTAASQIHVQQYIECNQSATACVCWQWKFACWNSSNVIVACPSNVLLGYNPTTTGNLTEATKLCYNTSGPGKSLDCTKCQAADFQYDEPTGWLDFNTTLCNGNACSAGQLRDCYTPSSSYVGTDGPWN
jgi:hypothetical protein